MVVCRPDFFPSLSPFFLLSKALSLLFFFFFFSKAINVFFVLFLWNRQYFFFFFKIIINFVVYLSCKNTWSWTRRRFASETLKPQYYNCIKKKYIFSLVFFVLLFWTNQKSKWCFKFNYTLDKKLTMKQFFFHKCFSFIGKALIEIYSFN